MSSLGTPSVGTPRLMGLVCSARTSATVAAFCREPVLAAARSLAATTSWAWRRQSASQLSRTWACTASYGRDFGGCLAFDLDGVEGFVGAFDHGGDRALGGGEDADEDRLAEGRGAGDGGGLAVRGVAFAVDGAGDAGDADVGGDLVEAVAGGEGVLELVGAAVDFVGRAVLGEFGADLVVDGGEGLFVAGCKAGDAEDLPAEGGLDGAGDLVGGGVEDGFGEVGAGDVGWGGLVELGCGGAGGGGLLLEVGPVGAGGPGGGELLGDGFVVGGDDLDAALFGAPNSLRWVL